LSFIDDVKLADCLGVVHAIACDLIAFPKDGVSVPTSWGCFETPFALSLYDRCQLYSERSRTGLVGSLGADALALDD
jgi:hypothetical protein